MTTPQARFFVGQVVHHRSSRYRGVIVDVDAEFAPGREHRRVTPGDLHGEPWYHVLVDRTAKTTYVAERELEADSTGRGIEHPQVARYFDGFSDGIYQTRIGLN